MSRAKNKKNLMLMHALVLGLTASAASAQPDTDAITALFDLAPADSQVLIVLPSAAGFSDKLTMLDSQYQLDMAEIKNLLTHVKRITGLSTGFKDDGPAMVAMTIEPGGDDSPPTARSMLFLPAADYAAMVGELGGKPDGVSQIKLTTNHVAYAKRSGDFAVIASDSQKLEAYAPGGSGEAISKTIGQVGNQCLQKSDAVLILHSAQMTGTIGALLELAKPAMLAAVNKALQPPAPQPQDEQQLNPRQRRQTNTGRRRNRNTGQRQRFNPPQRGQFDATIGRGFGPGQQGQLPNATGVIARQMAEGAITQTIDQAGEQLQGAGAWLDDAQAMVFGLDITDAGVGLSAAMQFKPDSKMAKAFTTGGGARTRLIALPGMQYMATMAISFDGVDLSQLEDQSMMPGMAPGAGDPVVAAIAHAAVAKLANVTHYCQVTYLPQQLGLTGQPTAKLIETDNPEGFVTALQQTLDQMNQQADEAEASNEPGASGASGVASLPGFAGFAGAMTYRTRYVSNQMQMGDYRVDQFVLTPNLGSLGLAGAMGADQLSGLSFGGLALEKVGYVVATDKGVVITESRDTTLLRTVLDALKSSAAVDEPLDEAMRVSRKQLGDDPSVQGYLDISVAYAMIRQSPIAAIALSQNLPQAPQQMEPIAVGAKVQDHGVIDRLFVPASVIDFTKSLIDQLRGVSTNARRAGRFDGRGAGRFSRQQPRATRGGGNRGQQKRRPKPAQKIDF